ncbi:PorT family protein [Nonlabens mediterrranea]|uniref:PorT family protein n=2 Tax=Nonlabens mediterrranea TaxID=1419947 RepID=A0ABS0A700_9FLAO|nr:PorT family protein [Nonlabens mediterrranea]
MKKIALSLILGVFALGVSSAQEIDFGVKGGVNFAKLTGDNVEDADGRTGFHVGLTGEYMFNDTFGLQGEVVYSTQGLQTEDEILGQNVEQVLKLDYINVPVLAKFYIADSGFSIDAGPQIGFLVSDKYEVNGENVDDELNAETIDLSAGGGVAYKFKEGTSLEGFNISARYMIGLSNVYKDNDTFGDDVTNSNLQVSLGYKF